MRDSGALSRILLIICPRVSRVSKGGPGNRCPRVVFHIFLVEIGPRDLLLSRSAGPAQWRNFPVDVGHEVMYTIQTWRSCCVEFVASVVPCASVAFHAAGWQDVLPFSGGQIRK